MTPPRRTISIRALNHVTGQGGFCNAAITLPAPPWGYLDIDDRSATAPRGGRITANRRWQDDPVLRHADKRMDRG